MYTNNGFRQTKQVKLRSGFRSRLPPIPEEVGVYVLDVTETVPETVSSWRLATGGSIDQAVLDAKADKNGDCEETFSVDTATEDCHAINKLQFDTKIQWCIEQPIDGGTFT